MSVPDLLRSAGRHSAGAVTDHSRSMTWPEFADDVERLAAGLTRCLPVGCRTIGIWGENRVDYLRVVFAGLWAGIDVAPLNTRLTNSELRSVIERAEVDALIVVGDPSATPDLSIPRVEFDQIPVADDPVDASSHSPSVIICSSGSGGTVKAVELRVTSMIDHAQAVVQHLSVRETDRWLACLPLFHVGGLTIAFRCALAGASISILNRPDPSRICRCIDEEGVSLISLVPTSLARLLDDREPREFPDSLRAIIVGGGPVPESLLDRCPIAYPTYGLTEAGSMLTCARPGCDEIERRSAGKALPSTRIRVMNESEEECSTGQAGWITAKAPGIARGYRGDEKETARAISEGWLKTDDFGYLDDHGMLHVVARRSDLILSGGENVYPAEIEKVLSRHPDVAEAVVVPIPDTEWGQVAGAAIVLRPDRSADVDPLREYLAGQLASYKIPKRFLLCNSLPTTASGKPDRAAIRKLFEPS